MWEGKKIGAIVQARMSSSRLPGKVLMPLPPLDGNPALWHTLSRLGHVSALDTVIVATSADASDNPLVQASESWGFPVVRGSLSDVLGRFHKAANEHDLDYIIRVTGDCPALDPALVQELIEGHFEEQADFSSLGIERTYPIGMDAAIFSRAMLEEANIHAQSAYQREHVTPYFRTQPDKFKIRVQRASKSQYAPTLRFTLDTPEDYHFLSAIFDALGPEFDLLEALDLLRRKPWIQKLNEGTHQKKGFDTETEELQAALQFCLTQDLHRAAERIRAWLNP